MHTVNRVTDEIIEAYSLKDTLVTEESLEGYALENTTLNELQRKDTPVNGL